MDEARPAAAVEVVDRADLASTVAALLARGWRYRILVGSDERDTGGTGLAVEVALGGPGGRHHVRSLLPLDDPAYPSLTPLVPAAQWDEREAQDLLGIVALGHPDPRRLVLHDRWPQGYHPLRKDVPAGIAPPLADVPFVPFTAEGEGVYQLPVGPIHAGIIEPGHFRFSAVGERVLHLDARLFFTHRGLEKLAEGRSLMAAVALVERACGTCTVTHALAWSQAVEQLTGTVIPDRASWARVVLAELERFYNHVGDMGNICAGIGFNPGSSRLAALKERLLQLNESVTGHRYLMGSVAPGGLREDLAADGLAMLPATLTEVAHELAAAVRAIIRSDGVHARLHGTGVVSASVAMALGATGVAGRASGVDADLRRDDPYAAYRSLDVGSITAAGGDVAARFNVRAQEAQDSLRLIREALGAMPSGPVRVPLTHEAITGESSLSGVEGPRGASWLWLRAGAGGSVDRVRLRSASFANWPVVAASVTNDLVPDFPLINKSFELCYACADR